MSEKFVQMIEEIGTAFADFRGRNDKRIEALERQANAIETAVSRGQFRGGGSSRGDGMSIEDAEYNKHFFNWVRNGNDDTLKGLSFKAALSTQDDPSGGFMVGELMEAAIDRVLAASSAMRRVAQIKRITTGTYKRLISQGGCEAGWATELEPRDVTDSPKLAEIAINAQELFALPKTTQTLLEDADFDVAAWLQTEIETAFAEQEGETFISGNGVGRPHGIAAYTMIANASYAWGKVGYIAGGHATLLNNADKLFSLQHALKRAYRSGAVWIMNDSTWEVVRKFKDGDGNYMWRPGLLQGSPDILLGSAVEIDDNVDDIGANKYPIFYGNFQKGYLIVDRIGVSVLRDPYTDRPNVKFYARKRVGGQIIMYEAIKALRISET